MLDPECLNDEGRLKVRGRMLSGRVALVRLICIRGPRATHRLDVSIVRMTFIALAAVQRVSLGPCPATSLLCLRFGASGIRRPRYATFR